MKEYKEHCNGTQFCDITTADLLVKKGIKLVNIKELRPWGIKKTEKNLISKNEVATLHYFGGQLTDNFKEIFSKMNYLHSLFTNIKESFVSNTNKLINNNSNVQKVVYCCWTGTNPLTKNRKECLYLIKKI